MTQNMYFVRRDNGAGWLRFVDDNGTPDKGDDDRVIEGRAAWDDAIPWRTGTYDTSYYRFGTKPSIRVGTTSDPNPVPGHKDILLHGGLGPNNSEGCIVDTGKFLDDLYGYLREISGAPTAVLSVFKDTHIPLTVSDEDPAGYRYAVELKTGGKTSFVEGETLNLNISLTGPGATGGITKDLYLHLKFPDPTDFDLAGNPALKTLPTGAADKFGPADGQWVKIPAGSTSVTVPIPIRADGKDEPAESVPIAVDNYIFHRIDRSGNDRYYKPDADGPAIQGTTVSVKDNVLPVGTTVSLLTNKTSYVENETVNLQVVTGNTRSSDRILGDLYVHLKFSDESDFDLAGNPALTSPSTVVSGLGPLDLHWVRIPQGQSSVVVPLHLRSDDVYEGNEAGSIGIDNYLVVRRTGETLLPPNNPPTFQPAIFQVDDFSMPVISRRGVGGQKYENAADVHITPGSFVTGTFSPGTFDAPDALNVAGFPDNTVYVNTNLVNGTDIPISFTVDPSSSGNLEFLVFAGTPASTWSYSFVSRGVVPRGGPRQPNRAEQDMPQNPLRPESPGGEGGVVIGDSRLSTDPADADAVTGTLLLAPPDTHQTSSSQDAVLAAAASSPWTIITNTSSVLKEGDILDTAGAGFSVLREGTEAAKVGWRVKPLDPHPVSGADFQGGALPQGVIELAEGQAASDSIYFLSPGPGSETVPGFYPLVKDGVPEGVEAFTIELFDPATGEAIPTPSSAQDVFYVHDTFFFGTLAGDADDHLVGGDESEYLSGGKGNDTLEGRGGSDTLDGGEGDDNLYGGPGDDYLIGGPGVDILDGGEGTDTADYTFYGKAVTVDLEVGRVWFPDISPSEPVDAVFVERILMGAGDDTVSGDRGPNLLDGGPGNDDLNGRAGRDTLVGGPGADRLDGGEDDDELLGGAGADTFVLAADQGNDVILDFHKGEDHLSLSGFRLLGRQLRFEDLDTNGDGVLGEGDTYVRVTPGSAPGLIDIRLDLASFAPGGRTGPILSGDGTGLPSGGISDAKGDVSGLPPPPVFESNGFQNRFTLRDVSGPLDINDFDLSLVAPVDPDGLMPGPSPTAEPSMWGP